MKFITNKIMANFFRGLLALLPLFVTLTLVVSLFGFIEGRIETLTAWVPDKTKANPLAGMAIDVAAFLTLFVCITATGLLVKTLWGKLIVKKIDRFLETIPGISVIYKSIRQIIDIVTIEKSGGMMKPVLVEYPGQSLWVIAFLTGEVFPSFAPPSTEKKYYTVFVPTTPNPTSGFLVLMPEDKISHLEISKEQAFKLILTGGMVKE